MLGLAMRLNSRAFAIADRFISKLDKLELVFEIVFSIGFFVAASAVSSFAASSSCYYSS